jgi:hypothetical protein
MTDAVGNACLRVQVLFPEVDKRFVVAEVAILWLAVDNLTCEVFLDSLTVDATGMETTGSGLC